MPIDITTLPETVQRVLAEVQQHPKVVAIFLFGSWARGEQMPISDVDIAVLLDNPDKRDEADIGSMYSPTVDLVLFHRLPVRIQFQVLKEGQPLFVRDEEKLIETTFQLMRQYHEMEWMYRRYYEEILR
ncbi:MAG: nucleotidyltransferase domain-containing protein [Firmicutes bacterium]|nr:nucleotidyltransferase domain-containing protein [Bacillota bacterium]